MGTNMITRLAGCGLAALLAVWCGAASATPLVFSGDQTESNAPLDALDVVVDWSFDANTNILTLDIDNQTVDPWEYTLVRFLFNTSDDVDSITWTGDDSNYNESINVTVNNGSQGGFGVFDWEMDFGQGNDGILPGDQWVFTFDVVAEGNATLDASDFFDTESTGTNGGHLANIHLARGPDDDSTWAVPLDTPVVPEPASVALLGMGIAGLAARRMRNKA